MFCAHMHLCESVKHTRTHTPTLKLRLLTAHADPSPVQTWACASSSSSHIFRARFERRHAHLIWPDRDAHSYKRTRGTRERSAACVSLSAQAGSSRVQLPLLTRKMLRGWNENNHVKLKGNILPNTTWFEEDKTRVENTVSCCR